MHENFHDLILEWLLVKDKNLQVFAVEFFEVEVKTYNVPQVNEGHLPF